MRLVFLGSDTEDVADTALSWSQCFALGDAYCDFFTTCDPSTSYAECQSGGGISLSCGFALTVSSTYDECMRDLQDGVCDTELPSSCFGVILF